MLKRTIIRIGVVLLAITLAALAGTAMISVYEGVGGIPIGHSRTGRQGVFIGVAYLPVFFIALVIGCFYIWQRLRKFWIARKQRGRAQSLLRRMF
jgi:hypothetical protein